MGCLLKWKLISTETSYDKSRVYRADSRDGTYTMIAEQTIIDNSYYDSTGNGTQWYKIAFYDSVNALESDHSDPYQGGSFFGYCSVDEVRQVTNIKASDVSDTDLAALIEFAGIQLNSEMNMDDDDEYIDYIEDSKKNTIDGVNNIFYTKNYPIADSNNDFRVTVADMEVYSINNLGQKTILEVTQITPKTGEFRLALAPSNVDLYVTYKHCNRRADLPDALIKFACIQLTAALGYSKMNDGKATRFHMGNLTVFRDTALYEKFYKRYVKLLSDINDRTLMNTVYGTDELMYTYGGGVL